MYLMCQDPNHIFEQDRGVHNAKSSQMDESILPYWPPKLLHLWLAMKRPTLVWK